jgi:hypothetical protein
MILHIDQHVTMCDHRWLYTPFRLNCAFTLYIFIYIIRTTLRGGCHPPPFSRRNLRHIYGRPPRHVLKITEGTVMDAHNSRRNRRISMNFHGTSRRQMRRYCHCHVTASLCAIF